ncbi:MAG TPA: helix-turn-helix transcriptional regulator [Thermomicrobiales bacterium]|jgi:transcriptional regulator with XRE-family HTH domain
MVAATDRAVTEALDRIEKDFGLTEQEVASALGVTMTAVEDWRRGESSPNRAVRQQIDRLLELRHHVYETFHPDDVVAWLHESHHYLGGLTPAASLQARQYDRVEALLTVIDHGIFT